MDNEIKSQIIQGCFSTRHQQRALREEMDLDKLLASARALELSEKQVSEIEKTETSQANVLRRKPKFHKTNKCTFAKKRSHFKPSNKQCRNCGGEYHTKIDYALRMIRTADFVRLRAILRVVVGRNI